MARLDPTRETRQRLFAESYNQCAFPGCEQEIIEDGVNYAEICHIEAASPGGERFNPNNTDEQNRAYENLILLCQKHHKTTNDVNTYTVEVLQKMKQTHIEVMRAKRKAETKKRLIYIKEKEEIDLKIIQLKKEKSMRMYKISTHMYEIGVHMYEMDAIDIKLESCLEEKKILNSKNK